MRAALRLIFIIAACVLQAAGALCQDGAPANRDWDPVFLKTDQDELVISDMSQLPRQLMRAIDRQGCPYKEMLASIPVRIYRVEQGYFALVPCIGPVYLPTQLFYFDRSTRQEPIPVQLTGMAFGRGFQSAFLVGSLRWDRATRTLIAEHSSDLCPTPAIRHVYAFVPSAGFLEPSPFVLTRIEVQKNKCDYGNATWTVLWEAGAWPDLKDLK